MDSKDNRSNEKRSKMKQHRKPAHKSTQNTSSSSGQKESIRGSGIADVVDSSDERYTKREGGAGWPMQQRRYSLEIEDDEENAQVDAGDFGLMSQLPTSIGGNFKFASEKNWDTTEELLDSTEASEYFTLNLKLLNVGLQTIPFHKRMDYGASMFTNEQLQAMEQAAELAEKNYQNVLKEHENNKRVKSSKKSGSAKSQLSKQAKSTTPTAQNSATAAEAPDDLDELLNMTTAQVAKIDVSAAETAITTKAIVNTAATADATTVNAGNANDIQEWLDNVLDE